MGENTCKVSATRRAEERAKDEDVTDPVLGRHHGMGPDVRISGELGRGKARDDGLACPITTALTPSSGVNRDRR